MQEKKPLIITSGEPAGIGMDIVLQLANADRLSSFERPIIVLADSQALTERKNQLSKNNSLSKEIQLNSLNKNALSETHSNFQNLLANYQPDQLNIIDIPTHSRVTAGQLNDDNANMVLAQLQLAHELAKSGQAAAIITAPLQKSVIMKVIPDFMGHTEYFMEQSGLDKVVMMLANATMKVALVTTHLPLRKVANAVTKTEVQRTIEIVLNDCQTKFGLANPKILVCGLNPHAGEDGHLGTEERDIINPVLQTYRDKGIDISLAMPADTLFTPKYVNNCDVIIAMYHDQGLAPLKSHGFGETVNITLGLPYIRTSVDHGTALDLAGTGKASSESLYQALVYANEMADKSVKI